MCHLLEGAGTASDSSLCPLGWAHSRCSTNVFWMKAQMMTNSKYGDSGCWFLHWTHSLCTNLADWLQRKCHQLSETQQHIAQAYVPGKPETCYCMCEKSKPTQPKKCSWTLHWTLTMYLYTFHPLVSLKDPLSLCSLRARSWGRIITPTWWCSSPCAFSLVLQGPFSSHRLESLTLEAATNTLILRESSFWLKDFKFIYLIYFIFGCVGSSLLRTGFLQLRWAGATLCCGAWASHCGGFSCCGARALGAQASVVVARRF